MGNKYGPSNLSIWCTDNTERSQKERLIRIMEYYIERTYCKNVWVKDRYQEDVWKGQRIRQSNRDI